MNDKMEVRLRLDSDLVAKLDEAGRLLDTGRPELVNELLHSAFVLINTFDDEVPLNVIDEYRGTCAAIDHLRALLYPSGLDVFYNRSVRTDPLADAVQDVCWKATILSADEDGGVFSYVVPAGALHRLVGAAQGAGISASFRDESWLEGHKK